VERKVLRRSFLKASTYGQDISGGSLEYSNKTLKLEPMLIAELYRDMIISLTKDVEVRYLYQRVGAEPPPPENYFHLCRGPLDAFEGIDITSLDEVRRNF
jgi:chorismate mutase